MSSLLRRLTSSSSRGSGGTGGGGGDGAITEQEVCVWVKTLHGFPLPRFP